MPQLISAPLQILGHDLYRRPDAGPSARLAELATRFSCVAAGRVLRIIPAYGVAGWCNDICREVRAVSGARACEVLLVGSGQRGREGGCCRP